MEKCGNLERPGFPVHSRAARHLAASAPESCVADDWKLHACSACAGDYEDPDRTAWPPDEDEERDEGIRHSTRERSVEEFPAEQL